MNIVKMSSAKNQKSFFCLLVCMDGFQGNGRMPIYESFRTTQYTIAKLNIKLSNGKKKFLNRGIFIFTKFFKKDTNLHI